MRYWLTASCVVWAACSGVAEMVEPVELPPSEEPIVEADPNPNSDPTATFEPVIDASVPIYGGTIAVDGERVVVAHPEEDWIGVWDLRTNTLQSKFSLPEGSQPFRVDIRGNHAAVSLRGSGEVAFLTLASDEDDVDELRGRVAVCAEPRGVAAVNYGLQNSGVFVACASGEIVQFDRDMKVVRTELVGPDLRDIVVTQTPHLGLAVPHRRDHRT